MRSHGVAIKTVLSAASARRRVERLERRRRTHDWPAPAREFLKQPVSARIGFDRVLKIESSSGQDGRHFHSLGSPIRFIVERRLSLPSRFRQEIRMSGELVTIQRRCADCGGGLSFTADTSCERHEPCPRCGSRTHKYSVAAHATAIGVASVRGVHRASTRRTRAHRSRLTEFFSGSDLSRRLGKLVQLDRFADRWNDWYREVVRDKDTGEEIHRCEEPLSRHRGRGSAKAK